MGAESIMFVQTRDDNGIWNIVPLFNENREYVDFFYCGRDVAQMIADNFNKMNDPMERKLFGIELNIEEMKSLNPFLKEDIKAIEDQNEFPMYCVSLSYLKMKAYEPHKNYFDDDDEYENYWSMQTLAGEIVKKVDNILELVDFDWIHPDNVRVACFISY